MMEYFDLYDDQMNKLDKTMVRGGENQPGEYHLVVHIWIRNKNGEYLIQQRNKKEDLIPYQWGVTSGAVLVGETSFEGAKRELQEEIGVTVDPSKVILLKRYFIDHPKSNYITDLYLIEEDILLDDLKLDKVEVRDVAYKTMADIKKMIENNEFWDYERMLERSGYFTILEES